MDTTLETLCIALDRLTEAILATGSSDVVLTEQYGWNCPAVTGRDLAFLSSDLVRRLREADTTPIPASLAPKIPLLTRQIGLLQSHTVPQLPSGNAMPASIAIVCTIESLERILSPLVAWQEITDTKALPPNLARRIRAYRAELDQLAPDTAELGRQLALIRDATLAADSLPTDLADLAEARKKVDQIGTEVAVTQAKIEAFEDQARLSAEAAKADEVSAAKLVSLCEEAYRITTTKGLAAAFDQRASKLAISMWTWVIGLVVALALAAYAGALRVELLSSSIAQPEPKWGVILMHVVLSVLSVGAPLWFAWLATRQVGQRFMLAEDYGFKASVAKAYEGYRKEAARLDPSFESRLFSSALSRLEEAPLRFVDPMTHGSPWHEFLNSAPVRTAVAGVPGFKDSLSSVVATAGNVLRPTAPSTPVTLDPKT